MTTSATADSTDSDFFAELLVALDRELGFEPWDEAQAQQLLDTAEPVPIAPACVDDVVERVRQEPPPPARPNHRPNHRPNRRRMLLPLGALALAACTIAYCRWQGFESTKTLSYERAFPVLFDQTFTANQRRSAHSVIYVGMKDNLTALRAVARDAGPLAADAARALERARLLIAGTVTPAEIPQEPRARSHTEVIARFSNQSLTTAERRAALREAVLLFEIGVRALREVEAQDPALRLDSEIVFLKLVNILDGKPPNDVNWKPR